MDLPDLLSELQTLRRAKVGDRLKPHKLVMLLSVLDMAETGLIAINKMYFSDSLITRFRLYFSLIADEGDWCQPAPPFFHLRTASFWKHKIKSGNEEYYASLKTSGGGKKRIIEGIDYVYLDEDVFRLFINRDSREAIRDFIISQFEDHKQERLQQALKWDNPYQARPSSVIIDGDSYYTSISSLLELDEANAAYQQSLTQIERLVDELILAIASNENRDNEVYAEYLRRAYLLGYSRHSKGSGNLAV